MSVSLLLGSASHIASSKRMALSGTFSFVSFLHVIHSIILFNFTPFYFIDERPNKIRKRGIDRRKIFSFWPPQEFIRRDAPGYIDNDLVTVRLDAL